MIHAADLNLLVRPMPLAALLAVTEAHEQAKADAFSREEAAAFIREASLEADDIVCLFQLFTGVRPEELAGLGWESVAFDDRAGCGAARMGHARPDFTKAVYVKVLPEMQQSLSGSFEKLLTETVGNQVAHLDSPGVM